MTRTEAKAEFDQQMSGKNERKVAVSALTETHGYALAGGPADADVIDGFIRRHAERSVESATEMPANWFSVLWDLSFVLGDMLIERYPGCHWALGGGPKSNVFYHTAMIQGFSRKRSTLGTAALRPLVGYSLRLLDQGNREPAGQIARYLDAQGILGDDA